MLHILKNIIRYNGIKYTSSVIVFFLILITPLASFAAETDIDPDFDAGTGADTGAILDAMLQSDGKILVVGSFTSFNGDASLVRIARLNSDGSVDDTFDPGTGANSTIEDVFVQDDGKILIGGSFTTYNGVTRNRIARLNSDGSLDTDFDPGTGPSTTVRAIDVQDDDQIIIGGSFVTYGGVNKKYVARLNTDGTLDTSFAQTSNEIFNTVTDVHVLADQKVVITGWFTGVSGTNRGRIARLLTNGNNDTSFASGTFGYGASSDVSESKILSDEKIVLVGSFTTFDSVNRRRVAVANSNGFLNTGFTTGTDGANDFVNTVDVQQDGKYIIGGGFTQYTAVNRARIARINTDGTLDTTFDTSVGSTVTIDKVLVQPDGKILVMGSAMTTFNGVSTGSRGITRLIGPDITDPTLQTATASSTELVLTYNETLDASSTPDAIDFTISVNGATSTPIISEIEGSTVILTLSPAVENGDTVTISYTSGINSIRDLAENTADNFTNQPVTNNTSDTTGPIVSNVATSTTDMEATITWTTDEQATTTLQYGTTISYGSASSSDSLATSHTIELSSLTPETLYHFRIVSSDASGNISTSTDYAFTTTATPDTTPPVISAVASTVTQTTAVITWTTNELATSTVEYGLTTGYGSMQTSASLVTSHTINLSGLTAGTLYHYRVSSADTSDNVATSTDYTFTTSAIDDSSSDRRRIIGSSYRRASLKINDTKYVSLSDITPTTIPVGSNIVLQLGDRDESIKSIQKLLNKFNFTLASEGPGSPGKETDYFGPLTEQALKKLQKTFSLPVDGVYGGETKLLLDDIVQLLSFIGVL